MRTAQIMLVLLAVQLTVISSLDILGGVKSAVNKLTNSINGLAEEEKAINGKRPVLPKLKINGRVVDLFNGEHFDDILRDTPDELRPPSIVAFFDSNDKKCMRKFNNMDFWTFSETQLPARERLFISQYDMYAAPLRGWFKFTPEMDLKTRFNVTACPQVVYVPQKCNGFTEWCNRGPDPNNPNVDLIGCADFKEQCSDVKHFNFTNKNTVQRDLLAFLKTNEEPEPQISKFFKTYKEQGEWIRKREFTTTNTQLRNSYLSEAFPNFTDVGFKAMPTPKKMQDFFERFYNDDLKYQKIEYWNADSTQLSFHDVPTHFNDMDKVRYEKDKLANEIIKPILEEWTGISPLELTSFYGMRTYHNDSWLRNHVDRIDTHVLSVTFSIKKVDGDNLPAWPLEAVQWSGDKARYNHPAGSMILYESSKLAHGRPYKNKGGDHLGAFVHFKPAKMNGNDSRKWDDIVKHARGNVDLHTQRMSYRQTDTVEPTRPVYSKHSYGESSDWKHSNPKDSRRSSGELSITFKNDCERKLDLYWLNTEDGSSVYQGSAAPGMSFGINSYVNHVFFWTESGATQPLPNGSVQVEKGTKVYSYNNHVKPNVNPTSFSRWISKAETAEA